MGIQEACVIEEPPRGTPYRIVRRLGQGGMGEIYEADALHEAGRVVVKVLRRDQSEMADRMRVEAEALAALAHPNIVGYRGRGRASDGRPYLVLEHVEGCTLRDELRMRGAMPMGTALALARQLLSALGAVHGAGLVHRDVKPENIMIAPLPDGRLRLKLLDFGIVKVVERAGPVRPLALPTTEGFCVGTPRYAAPEQGSGDDIDRRADIYGAGIVLYTMLAGRGPFDEIRGAGNLVRAHAALAPPPPSRFSPIPISADVEAAVLRAIAKDPRARFADAASFCRALFAAVGHSWPQAAHLPTRGSAHVDVRETAEPSRTTLVARRFDEVSTVIQLAEWPGDEPSQGLAGRSGALLARRSVRTRVSGAEVLVSAAAFGAMAATVAMWFVR
ncbi:MAG TPA: serine/threonine-protein kinase [Polyangiaceae bacterium]|nr:serine/threonine-protein kinase [Polyangiaceae bacterium]